MNKGVCFWQKGHTFYYIFPDGTVRSTRNVLLPVSQWHEIATYNGKGYRRIRLQGKTFKVHRLVAEHFLENPDNLPYVLHINGNRDDNRVGNLMWSARQSNHP